MGAGIKCFHYFGKIAIANNMFSGKIIDPLMKIISTSISILMFCMFVVTITNPVHAAVVTGTITAGTTAQTQTGTPGTQPLTYTPSPSPSVTPTTTLLPLPAITLIFPASTSTSTPTITPRPIMVTETPIPSDGIEFAKLSPRIRILTILLVILWLILAVFVIIYIRMFR